MNAKTLLLAIAGISTAISRKNQSLSNFERRMKRAIEANQEGINKMRQSKVRREIYIEELKTAKIELEKWLDQIV